MYNLLIAEYIKTNKEAHHMTFDFISEKSDTPVSTISAYAKAQVTSPKDETLIRIAAVFGDGPDVIYKMKQAAAEATEKEKKLIASSSDEQRMKQLADLIRTSVSALLEEYRIQAAQQQTEILEHADRRVEEERIRFKERAAEVVRQCNEEMARNKELYDQRYKMTLNHCEQRVADIKEHMNDVLKEKRDSELKMSHQYSRNREFLKSCVRNLSATSIILMLTNIFFGAYAVFSYTVFDMADPTRGLHRESHSVGPLMLFLSIVMIGYAAFRLIVLYIRRPKERIEEVEQ